MTLPIGVIPAATMVALIWLAGICLRRSKKISYITVLPAVFGYRYFAGIRFTWRSVFLVGITILAGTPFFRNRRAGCIEKGACAPFFLKKGVSAPFLREKGVPAKKMIPKCTDRDFSLVSSSLGEAKNYR
jgi:hypothetical protein